MLASRYKIVALLTLVSLSVCSNLHATNALSLFGSGGGGGSNGSSNNNNGLNGPQLGAAESNAVSDSLKMASSQIGQDVSKATSNALGGQQGQNTDSFDPTNMQQLLEFGLNPVGSTAKYFLPGTYSGLNSDLQNTYSMLSNGAQNGYSQLSSMMPQNTMSMFNPQNLFRNRYTELLQQRLTQTENMLRQMYELASNPEQMCRQFMQQTKNGLDQASNALGSQQQSFGAQASSLQNKIGNGFPFF